MSTFLYTKNRDVVVFTHKLRLYTCFSRCFAWIKYCYN